MLKVIVNAMRLKNPMWGKEGRVFRNNYKGHMDKTKDGVESVEGGGDGWGGGECWGEKADNCTWTTIKFFKKEKKRIKKKSIRDNG